MMTVMKRTPLLWLPVVIFLMCFAMSMAAYAMGNANPTLKPLPRPYACPSPSGFNAGPVYDASVISAPSDLRKGETLDKGGGLTWTGFPLAPLTQVQMSAREIPIFDARREGVMLDDSSAEAEAVRSAGRAFYDAYMGSLKAEQAMRWEQFEPCLGWPEWRRIVQQHKSAIEAIRRTSADLGNARFAWRAKQPNSGTQTQ